MALRPAPLILALLLSFAPALAQEDGKAERMPKIERVRKLLDVARNWRAERKYDAAVAAYREALKSATSAEIERGIVIELGEVLEVQEKFQKALAIYSQTRQKDLELELLLRLKLYQRGLAKARLYADYGREGDFLMGLRRWDEALEIYRRGSNRLGEAKALIKLGFRESAAGLYAAEERHLLAAEQYAILKREGDAKRHYQLARVQAEKRLVRLINEIRKLRAQRDPARRTELGLGALEPSEDRSLRLLLARRYLQTADAYQTLADVFGALDASGDRRAMLQQVLNFLQLYQTAFTDGGKDNFGTDRLKALDFFTRLGAVRKALDG